MKAPLSSNLRTHDLKCWPPFFASLLDGSKTFEIRWDDRNFRVGDTLHIREYNPETQTYTGAEVHRRVTYIFNSGNRFGLQPGWAVLGLAHETSVPPTPTATCVNCGTVDEFSVRHCDPDEVGAVYPVIECHACGQKWSDWRGEDARTASIESAQKSTTEPK